ncbi:MAG: protein kinase, partial [Planctomycetota bacterium]
RALHHAHESGVVHRDLKPANIMVDAAGDPHVVDFGLAKRDAGEVTMTVDGQILGTPAYMSPEQARGEGRRVDRRADLYALGVVLFELLTGELPFRGAKPMLILQILHDEPPSLRSLNPSVPRDLETVCLKCIEKNPARRYNAASELAADFDRYLSGVPVLARPISPALSAWRWCERNPVVAGLCASVAVLVAAITVVSSIGYYMTSDALRISEKRADVIEQNLYYSEMNTAGAATRESGGLAIANELVRNWQPNPRRKDHRGWEWYYLNALLHEEIATFSGHPGGVCSVAWSHDGEFLAVGCGSGELKIWNKRGEIIQQFDAHAGPIRALRWSHGGLQLATGGDSSVKIWDLKTGSLETVVRHEGPISAIAWRHND